MRHGRSYRTHISEVKHSSQQISHHIWDTISLPCLSWMLNMQRKNLLCLSCIECTLFLRPVFYAVVSFPLGHFSMHFDAFQQQIGELPPALPARSLRKVSLTKFPPFLVLIMHASWSCDVKKKLPLHPVTSDLDVHVGVCIHWFTDSFLISGAINKYGFNESSDRQRQIFAISLPFN